MDNSQNLLVVPLFIINSTHMLLIFRQANSSKTTGSGVKDEFDKDIVNLTNDSRFCVSCLMITCVDFRVIQTD